MNFIDILMHGLAKVLASFGIIIAALLGFVETRVLHNTPAAYAPAPTYATSTDNSTIATTSASTSMPIQKSATTTQKITSLNASAGTKPKPTPTISKPSAPSKEAEQVNSETRASLVNILCTMRDGSIARSISGSGVIIDTRGVILTNAHIAQFFLLRDYPAAGSTDCTVRTGSPAQVKYRAALLYLPPTWIEANASQIIAEHAMGTGEYDYAFLAITESIQAASPLPSSFPAIGMITEDAEAGEKVLLASYPAGFLDSTTIAMNLYASSVFTVIQKLFTFDDIGYVDVVSVGGTIVSQGGSSGGAVVRADNGELTGLIATATTGATTGDRDLRAITVAYIDRSLQVLGKGGILGLLQKSIPDIIADFASTNFSSEKQKLINVLKK